jgi:hypothetical protein
LSSVAQKNDKEDFASSTFFDIALVSPSTSYVASENPSGAPIKTMATEIELGSVFNIKATKIKNIACFGIIADYFNVGCNYFTFQEANAQYLSKVAVGRWSANVGPNISFRCFKDAYADIFIKGRATLCYDYVKTAEVNENSGYGFGIRYSFGMNFRWKMLLIGGEIVMGKTKISNFDPPNTGKLYPNSPVLDNFAKLKVGFCF